MAKKIKITYIMPSMARGGAERFLIDLIDNLNKDIFEPSVIIFKEKGAGYNELQTLNIQITVLEKKSTIDFHNILNIIRQLKNDKPDIVHTQLGGDLRGRLAAKLAGVKVIISTEQNTNFNEAISRRLVKIFTSCLTDKIIAISPAVARDMKHRYLLPKHKCNQIIPNGINLNKFIFSETRPGKVPLIVGGVGRLTAQKGFDLLIEAWKRLKLDNIRLIIAGSGPDKDNLNRQIIKNNLTQQIQLSGDVADMSDFYQHLDLFVMPSRWEGLGIAALEAGACGVPVVASAVGGLSDFITEETGWTFKVGDIDSLKYAITDAITAIKSNKTNSKQIKLRSLIVEKFSIQQVALAYEKLYLELFKEKYEDSSSK